MQSFRERPRGVLLALLGSLLAAGALLSPDVATRSGGFGRSSGERAHRGQSPSLSGAGRKGAPGGGPISRARLVASHALVSGATGESGELLKGMALGDDSGLSTTTVERFRRSSLTHVTAASGQNIALLLALLLPLLTLLGLRHRWRLAACGLVAVVYVPLSGGESPVRRACVMALCGLVATGRGRRSSPTHALLVAATVTLLLDPAAIRTLSWQLSFAAVCGMLAIGPALGRRLRGLGLPRSLSEVIALTVSATLVTTPLIAHSVGSVSLTAIPANLVAGPPVAAAMLLALAATLVAQVAVWPAELIAACGSIPAAAVLWTADVFGGSPSSAVRFRPGAITTIAALVLPLILVAASRHRRTQGAVGDRLGRRSPRALPASRALAWATGCGLVVVAFLAGGSDDDWHGSSPSAHFLAVGQGDAQLLRDGRSGILVDTGPPGTPIAGLVSGLGVERLDALVLTHGQADHVGALGDLLRRFRPAVVVDGTRDAPGGSTDEVRQVLRRSGLSVVSPRPGLSVGSGRASFTVLPSPSGGRSDPNGRSVVGMGRVGGLEILLTADAESDVTAGVVGHRIDVLKLAHHGSADPGLGGLLAELSPRLVVIEVGRNPYGHPTPSALAASSASALTLRTDRHGTISVSEGVGGRLEWMTSGSA